LRTQLVAKPGTLTEKVRHTLNAIDGACFPKDYLYPKDDCYWWIISDEKGPVAFAGLRPCKTKANAGMAFLCRAGVRSRAAGQGLQRKLIKKRVAYAQKIGIREVVTYTHPENFESATNLLRSGMRFYSPANKWGVANAMYFHRILK
jgi:RimJ/RimL family protein N-acetyltransferase